MYNEYDNLSFDDQIQITEEQIRRRHNQRMFLRHNAELLQQELELEAELLDENPELAETIHQFNLREIQSHQQGLQSSITGESTSKPQSIWSKLFPGLGDK